MLLGKRQNQISELPSIARTRYENIFRLYKTEKNQYFYNLLQSLYIDGDIDISKITNITIKKSLPWSIISYNAYGTMDLWWLIMLTNKIYNPIKQPDAGVVLKVVKHEYVDAVLQEINKILHQ